MEKKKIYEIPLLSMEIGDHTYSFELDDKFFEENESDQITKGDLKVIVTVDKKYSFYEMTLKIDGTVELSCDRCLADFNQHIKNEEKIIVKVTEHPKEDEAELIYIHPDTSNLYLNDILYDMIHLQIPIVNNCDQSVINGVRVECDQAFLDKYLVTSEFNEDDNDDDIETTSPFDHITID